MVGVLTLPKRKKYDWFDCKEFQYRIERPQQFPRSKIKQEQGIKCQRDGKVVDQGDVEVAEKKKTSWKSSRVSKFSHLSGKLILVLHIILLLTQDLDPSFHPDKVHMTEAKLL